MYNRNLAKAKKISKQVLAYADAMSRLTDEQLRAKTDEFKQRIASGEGDKTLLPEAFAVVREAAKRVLHMEPYPVQVIGGKLIHDGCIAEIKTGEGKTLICTMPVYYNALSGKGVHVITVNDYLASRDSEWMGRVYRFLGLSVGLVIHDSTPEQRRAAYACDITYATNVEVGFDWLRDNMVFDLRDKVQRPFNFAVVDEADSVLIDDAKTPLIISGLTNDRDARYREADAFVKTLHGITVADVIEGEPSRIGHFFESGDLTMQDPYAKYEDEYDYVACEKDNSVMLMPKGQEKMIEKFNLANATDSEYGVATYFVNVCLKANALFKRNVDYIVDSKGEVVIVDVGTGRLMPGRRYTDGIHQALEAKEGVEIQPEDITIASITYQNLFLKYDRISGMTGTAATEKDEFADVYGLDVIPVPTNRPVIRKDYADAVYSTTGGKDRAIVTLVTERNRLGQPVLIGTTSVEESEHIHELLLGAFIEHRVLNAREHEKEAHIIAQAGRLGAVTVATNMAGRGTDILLGGDPKELIKQEILDAGETIEESDYEDSWLSGHLKRYYELKEQCAQEGEKVRSLGGLFVLGTERHVSRRIDNQLRGRAGRQGDPGESLFIVSLEDDLLRLYGLDNVKKMMTSYVDPDKPLDFRILSSAIETAQKNVSGRMYAQRRQTMDYDTVDAVIRDKIYEQRDDILCQYASESDGRLDTMLSVIYKTAERLANFAVSVLNPDKIADESAYNEALSRLPDLFGAATFAEYEDLPSKTKQSIASHFKSVLCNLIREVVMAAKESETFCRNAMLTSIDSEWTFILSVLDDVKRKAIMEAVGGQKAVVIYQEAVFGILRDLQHDTDIALIRQIAAVWKALAAAAEAEQ